MRTRQSKGVEGNSLPNTSSAGHCNGDGNGAPLESQHGQIPKPATGGGKEGPTASTIRIDSKNHCLFCLKPCSGLGHMHEGNRLQIGAEYMAFLSNHFNWNLSSLRDGFLGNFDYNQARRKTRKDQTKYEIFACNNCLIVMKETWDKYQQSLKSKLELDWKIAQMRKIMEAANKDKVRVEEFKKNVTDAMTKEEYELLEKIKKCINSSFEKEPMLVLRKLRVIDVEKAATDRKDSDSSGSNFKSFEALGASNQLPVGCHLRSQETKGALVANPEPTLSTSVPISCSDNDNSDDTANIPVHPDSKSVSRSIMSRKRSCSPAFSNLHSDGQPNEEIGSFINDGVAGPIKSVFQNLGRILLKTKGKQAARELSRQPLQRNGQVVNEENLGVSNGENNTLDTSFSFPFHAEPQSVPETSPSLSLLSPDPLPSCSNGVNMRTEDVRSGSIHGLDSNYGSNALQDNVYPAPKSTSSLILSGSQAHENPPSDTNYSQMSGGLGGLQHCGPWSGSFPSFTDSHQQIGMGASANEGNVPGPGVMQLNPLSVFLSAAAQRATTTTYSLSIVTENQYTIPYPEYSQSRHYEYPQPPHSGYLQPPTDVAQVPRMVYGNAFDGGDAQNNGGENDAGPIVTEPGNDATNSSTMGGDSDGVEVFEIV